jgi:hypothetical protein
MSSQEYQETLNQLEMQFVQYWRENQEDFKHIGREKVREIFSYAFLAGAIEAIHHRILAFDRLKKKDEERK